jgi:hypothetical protein
MGDVGIHSLKKAAEIFPDEPPKNDGTINKHSALLTQDPSRGGVQAYMYALGLTKEDMKKAQICIASVWFEVGVRAFLRDGCCRRLILKRLDICAGKPLQLSRPGLGRYRQDRSGTGQHGRFPNGRPRCQVSATTSCSHT